MSRRKSLKDGPRIFTTGASRNNDIDLPDYEGFLSPLVIEAYGRYMHKHRHLKDGSMRASDNWQKGIPKDAYIKSAFRHFVDWWVFHRGGIGRDTLVDALCALLFNVSGYLHETLSRKDAAPYQLEDAKGYVEVKHEQA